MPRLRSTVYIEMLLPLLLSGTLFAVGARGQQLSESEKVTLAAARAKYYDLKGSGFQSLSCSIKFDWATVPLLSAASNDSSRKLLDATRFTLILDGEGHPSFEPHYPAGATDAVKQSASQITSLLNSLVTGLFQTWPTKGLRGPLPPFDSQVESVASTDSGYVFTLRVPGGPVRITTDRNYLALEIVSFGGKINEHVTYLSSPDGLIFTGNDVLDESHPGSPVEVHYQLGNAVIEGLRVPSSAHLKVNQNIDVKFVLEECAVRKATALHVAPPPSH